MQNTLDCKPTATIKINKVCDPATSGQTNGGTNGYHAVCHITVTTTGAVLNPGLSLSDLVLPTNVIPAISQTGGPSWTCSSGICSATPAVLGNSSTSTFDAFIDFPDAGAVKEQHNCATARGQTSAEGCSDFTVKEVDSQLYVKKIVVNHAPGSVAGLQFTIEDSCNSTQNHGFANMVDGQLTHFKNYESGVSCTINETSIPATTACGALVPHWSTTYSPSQTVALNPNGVTVTVTNTLDCSPIIHPTPSTQTITKVCDPATEVVGAINHYESKCHLTVSTTGPVTGIVNVGEAITGPGTIIAATGPSPWACTTTNCSVAGSALNQTSSTSVFDVTVKFSNSAQEVTGQNCANLTVGAGAPVTSCAPFTVGGGQKGSLTIIKDAQYNGNHITTQPFPMTVSCGGKNKTQNVTDGTPFTLNNLAAGTQCSVVEGTAAVAAGLCPAGTTGSWQTTYTPATPVSIAALTATTITVHNLLTCKSTTVDNTGVVGPAVIIPDVLQQNETGDGILHIQKIVVNHSPGSVSGLEFEIHDLCPTATQPSGSIHLNDGETASLKHYEADGLTSINPPLSGCEIAEGTMPVTAACGNLNPKWTATFTPASMVGINGIGNVWAYWTTAGATLTITNTLDCVPPSIVKPAEPLVTKPVVILPTIVKPPVDTNPKCDPATATSAGDLCRCRFDNMSPTSKTECGCVAGFSLQPSKGCVKIITTPKCNPPQVYERASSRCITPRPVCKDPQAYDANRNRCITPRPTCESPEVYNPRTNSCFTPRPVCKRPQVYNPATNSCITVRPVCGKGQVYQPETNRCVTLRPVCTQGQVYNPGRNQCVDLPKQCPRGTLKLGDRCVAIPRCAPGTIPMPGTGICINIGRPRPPVTDGPRPPQGGVQTPRIPGIELPGL